MRVRVNNHYSTPIKRVKKIEFCELEGVVWVRFYLDGVILSSQNFDSKAEAWLWLTHRDRLDLDND